MENRKKDSPKQLLQGDFAAFQWEAGNEDSNLLISHGKG